MATLEELKEILNSVIEQKESLHEMMEINQEVLEEHSNINEALESVIGSFEEAISEIKEESSGTSRSAGQEDEEDSGEFPFFEDDDE